MDAGLVVFVVVVVIAAAIAQTTAGFGFALIAVPLLVTVLPVQEAVPLTAMLATVNAVLVARVAWQAVPRRLVATLLAGAVAGMPLGLVVLLFAPAEPLRIGVSLASIAIAALLASGVRITSGGSATAAAIGALSGVLTTSTGINGPPVVVYLQDRRLVPLAFRGTLAVFFLVSNVLSLTLFAVSGVLSWRTLLLFAFALPSVFAGNRIGHELVGRLSEVAFRLLVLVMLVAGATAAVVASLVRILG
jgi:uncharacterized membrane protein YfcA